MIKAQDNNCIDIYSHVRGLCLDYRLLVTVATDDPVYPQTLDKSLSDVVDEIIGNDQPYNPALVDSTFANGYVTYRTRVVVKLETFTDVRESVREFVGKLKYAPYIPGTTVQLDIARHAYAPQALNELGYLSFEDATSSIDGCTKMVAMTPIQICEMVMFSPEQYSIRGTSVILRDGREFQSYEYVLRPSRDGNRHLQICLETYLYRSTVQRSDLNQNQPDKCVISVFAAAFLHVLIDISNATI